MVKRGFSAWDFIKSPFTSDPPEKSKKVDNKKENVELKKNIPENRVI
jgi:hypothetical protein